MYTHKKLFWNDTIITILKEQNILKMFMVVQDIPVSAFCSHRSLYNFILMTK